MRANAAQSIDLCEAWRGKPGAFAAAVQPGAGFSFHYHGKDAGPVFAEDWQTKITDGLGAGATRRIFTHSSGLVVTQDIRELQNSLVLEYKLRFRNSASNTLPAISRLKALDLSFDGAVGEGSCVISSTGGFQDSCLPPRAFNIRRSWLQPSSCWMSVVDLSSDGGRSSDKDMPMFLVHNEVQQAGVYVALGWSGQWQALARINSAPAPLQLIGGIPDVEIELEPGEEIEGPTVVVGLYQGTALDGSNALRRLIRDSYTPKLAGQRMLPVATFNSAFAVGMEFDESLLKQLADGAAQTGQEYFLLDAGWHEGDDWNSTVGNWETVNSKKLPHGLNPVADYIRSKGLEFGLWFDLERVAPDTQLAIAHPDWVLWDHGREPAPWLHHAPYVTLVAGPLTPPPKICEWGVLDYGNPEVQEYVKGVLGRYIREAGVKYIRYDFNIDPLPYWRVADKPTRRGITQLRHIQGLYDVLDWVLCQFPDVIIENCASGGNRLDLGMMQRSHTAWINDHSTDPAIIRYHLSGINHFVPGNYSYILYSLPRPFTPEAPTDFEPDDLGFQSLFGGAFGIGVPIHTWIEPWKARALRHVQIWKQLRRYLIEDYYPLSPQPADMTSWSGWQFHDPNDQSGFMQTFRTNTSEAAHRFALHELDDAALYRFTDAYSGETFEVTGASALTEGVEVCQATMSSRVLHYSKTSN